MEVKRDEYWVAKIQMRPGDKLLNRTVWIYQVEKSGDIGFMLIGDEDIHWRSQVEWFELIRRLAVSENDVE